MYFPMRILGIDPGLNTTGYGLLEALPGKVRLVEGGVIRSGPAKSAADLAERLKNLFDGLGEILDEYKPAAMAVEQLYAHYAHPRTAIIMGHARGVLLLAAGQRGVPVFHYSATQVKKTISGAGHASKVQMQMVVTRELGLAKPPEPVDVTDALAIALCHAFAQKRPDEIQRKKSA